MSVKNNVPKIRFRGFSGEWLNNLIGDICGVTFGGGTPATSEKSFWQGDIPWIQSSDLKDGNISSVTAKKHITKAAINKSATKLVSGHSIAIVTRVGVGKLSLMEGEYATSQDFLSLSDLKIDARYSAYAILKQLQNDKEQVQGTSIKGITKEELLSKTISHPKLKPEQTKIGNLFQKLDELINQHQQKHDKLSNFKKSMLEKMFPKQGETIPEIRFKGFSGEWVENNLGELIDIRSAARVHKEQWTEAGVPFFRTSDVVSIYKGQENTKAYISHATYHDLSEKIGKVTKDDLLITGGGSIGIPYLVPNDNPLYFKDADLLWLKNNKKINGYFLYTFFFTAFFKQHIKSISHTGTIAHYTIEQAKATPINTCSDEEQTQIGNYFQKLDNLIDQHQQQITKLNNIKQACLSKMFV